MKDFLSLLKLLKPYRLGIVIALLFSFLTVVSNVGLMAVSAVLISWAALHPPILDLMTTIVAVRFFGISRAVFRYLERYFSHDVTFKILKTLRIDFYSKLEPLAPACLKAYRSGDLLARLVGEVEALKDFYLRVLAPPLTAFLVLIGVFIFLSDFDLKFALVFLVFYFLTGIIIPLTLKRLSRGLKEEMLEVKADLNARLVDSIQGMTEITVYGQAENQLRLVAGLGGKLARLQGKMAGFSGLTQAGSQIAMNLAGWCVLVLAIPMVASGRLEGIFLAMLPLCVGTSFEAVASLPLVFSYWEESRTAWKRLREVTEAPNYLFSQAHEPQSQARTLTQHLSLTQTLGQSQPQTQTPVPVQIPTPNSSTAKIPTLTPEPNPNPNKTGTQEKVISVPELTGQYSLEIKDLWFRYSPEEPWIFRGVSFNILQGEKVALTGPSGAGKSTLVNLLLRFYEYEIGTIKLGGKELKSYRPEDIRQVFGVVSQTTHLFNTTIRENLLLAKPSATEQEMWEAAKKAKIHDFIQSLPQGYDTYIGEGGYKLSGGQRQRVAIARALLKNAPILVLDEATANLDALAEREVLESLLELFQARTVLVIAHRRAPVKKMDKVIDLPSVQYE